MNQKEIQDLIKFVSKSDVTEVEIEMKDFKIIIKSESKKVSERLEDRTVYIQQPQIQTANVPTVSSSPVSVETVEKKEQSSPKNDEDRYITIKSPMIGTFYRSSSPDKPVFVEVGDTIKTGDTVCIIEAMKLFNEIEAEIKGKIVKILVDDATPVEYDQPLFLVDPA